MEITLMVYLIYVSSCGDNINGIFNICELMWR